MTAFEALKEHQSVIWGSGPYERVTDTIADVHDAIVGSLAPRRGERWLDVATGTGAVARRLARAGADVTGLDLGPALIDTARRQAAEEALAIRFDAGDAERLPYPDESFDGVVSTFGTMFAPEHWQLFSTSFGPTKTLAESLDAARREELHRTWVSFFEERYPGRDGGVCHTREYLVVLGTRR